MKILCAGLLGAVVAFCIGGCGKDTAMDPKDELIECQAKLIRVVDDAQEVLYEEGGGAWFDMTTFFIESPYEFMGTKLDVLTQRYPSDSPWRAVGKRFRFSIQRKCLVREYRGEGDSVTIYEATDGSIIDLEPIE